MIFEYTPELLTYMKKKKKTVMIVEIISSDSSDFNVTELYVHLISDSLARSYVERKNYRSVPGDHGTVLLPPYRLEYDETISFGLKKLGPFSKVTCTGVTL